MNRNFCCFSSKQSAYQGRILAGAMCMALIVLGVGSSGLKAMELQEIVPDRITHELVMRIDVKLGPTEDMGIGVDGHRINYPIIGGTFVGKNGLSGVVVPGGADMSIRRNDGVDMVEALYRIRTHDGQIIIVHNAGIFRVNEAGRARLEKGESPMPGDIYARTIPSFKTQPGPYNWLNDYIFVGTIDPAGKDGVMISIYRIDGV